MVFAVQRTVVLTGLLHEDQSVCQAQQRQDSLKVNHGLQACAMPERKVAIQVTTSPQVSSNVTLSRHHLQPSSLHPSQVQPNSMHMHGTLAGLFPSILQLPCQAPDIVARL